MLPVLRRTWAPCGATPTLAVRTRHHEKVSGIGALIVSPRRRHVTLPLALFTYYPGQRLLGRNESGALLPILSTAAAPAGLVLLGIAGLVWRAGLRHYQSTGS